MRVWCLALVLIGAVTAAQDNPITGDFTKSPTEHIINIIEQPFVVRSVQGSVQIQGNAPGAFDVLFEIQGPGNERTIRHVMTDKRGQFKIGHVPDGEYKFKATLNGFQSVMGRITVSGKAPKQSEIKVLMRIGI